MELTLNSIKKEKIHELLYRKQSMEVYELARQLNVPSAAIIIASKITEVNVDSMVRLLSFDEIKKIAAQYVAPEADDPFSVEAIGMQTSGTNSNNNKIIIAAVSVGAVLIIAAVTACVMIYKKKQQKKIETE